MRGRAGSALQLMAERAEYMVAGGPEARAVQGPATAAAARNIALAGLLADVVRSVSALLPRLPAPAAAALECAAQPPDLSAFGSCGRHVNYVGGMSIAAAAARWWIWSVQ